MAAGFSGKHRQTQGVQVLALLVESGLVYGLLQVGLFYSLIPI
jgi:hypothetical protein